MDDEERQEFYDNDQTFSRGSVIWAYPRVSVISKYSSGKRLLDVGCGEGDFLATALQMGFQAVGLDVSKMGIKDCLWKRLPVLKGELEQMQFADGAFDIVTFYDVIEHVKDPAGFLTEVRRILVPGGIVSWSCPNLDSWPSKNLKENWWTLRPEQHLWHFTPKTVAMLFGENGYTTVYWTASPLDPSNLLRFDCMFGVSKAA
jgi:2-polyprenyl-3-methyl-5-hydroxy-6-metoxy-1,4-benzoquinol methylase